MYDRFTDRARKIMLLANSEAIRLNHEYVGTEHILLGLVKERSGVGAYVIRSLQIDLDKVVRETERFIQPGPVEVSPQRLPLTPRARRVLDYACEEACSLEHDFVGSEHMLLGLLAEQEGFGAQLLMHLGLNPQTVRTEVKRVLGTPPRPKVEGATPSELNPYDPPRHNHASSALPVIRSWLRFSLFLIAALILVGSLSLLRQLMTWRAFGTDGLEQIGWPWVFFERGGYSYGEFFYPQWLVADILVAVGLAYFAAIVSQRGIRRIIAAARTWGTTLAE